MTTTARYPARYEAKDLTRIEALVTKGYKKHPADEDAANEKMEALARQMAKSIQKADKAGRRGRAAEEINYHTIAAIFFARCDELNGR